MRDYKLLLRALVLLFLSGCAILKKGDQHQTNISDPVALNNNSDAAKVKLDTNKSKLKPYKEVITPNAITDSGLLTIHKIDDRYFFEIPNTLLEKDILIVSRISQGPAGIRKDRARVGYGGDQIGESQIQFSRGPGSKLFIRQLSYSDHSADSSANGMYRSLKASSLQPIQVSFDIKAYSNDSAAIVVEVSDFLNSDNPLIYFDGSGKKVIGLGAYQKDKSYITEVKSFPMNVELGVVNTYLSGELPVSFGLNVSFVLMPEQPMKPRFYDKRVGYFVQHYTDFDAPESAENRSLITRWRLEPKEADRERYLKGELVEPQKPIVYYIDPATPKKWVPYLIQGVNDWQKAFEKAGFKHAIYALEAPINDPEFSLLDARHNAIIYKSSTIPNASGPHVRDPRTGEILETHVNWYHNVQSVLHDWYMVQASPNDCEARKMVFDDSLMGQLIRFVACHEVGHTLGLRHNMGASSTVPTDSLRSKTYLDKNGFCPSIMDYARFNYVAQPEDNLSRDQLMPRIGVYDEWAIEWGYRWFPQLKTREQETAYMNHWIISKLDKDKRLWWGEYEAIYPVYDPRCQTEDLGDDAFKASFYGIKNLKRVMDQLTEWAVESNEDYSGLGRMYQQVINQYKRYVIHVANNIGSRYWTEKKAGQTGAVIQFVPKTVQRQALKFLGAELFDTPEWLYNKKVFALTGGPGEYEYLSIQKQVIDGLVDYINYLHMSWAQMQQPHDAYTYDEFLTDLEGEIWKELKTKKTISFARRNLQKAYTERLIEYALPNGAADPFDKYKLMLDFYPLFRKHLSNIVANINKQLPCLNDETARLHLLEIRSRCTQALQFARFAQQNKSAAVGSGAFSANSVSPTCTSQNTVFYPFCWYPFE